MSAGEEAITFPCAGSQLVGIVHRPAAVSDHGVLVVVGGPQYRTGSHRQFTLLARHLAGNGVAVMRFDYRGMGDSEGGSRSFEDIGDDIRAAIDEFQSRLPEIKSVLIWGLCDAASAAILYAPSDPRVGGLVLLNPWVRTEAGEAITYIRHYYSKRIFSAGMWGKILRGNFNYRESIASLVGLLGKVLAKGNSGADQSTDQDGNALPIRMCTSLESFGKPALFILSGNQDYVATEFKDTVSKSECWKKLMESSSVTKRELTEANHTFSSSKWRGMVESWTLEWIRQRYQRGA